MALPDSLVLTQGTGLVFAHSDYSPTVVYNNLGTKTANHDLDLTSVAAGEYEQSIKVTLPASRAPLYGCWVAIEFVSAPAAGLLVTAWWVPSWSATAGIGNPGGATGVSSAYVGYSANAANSVKQLQLIGSGSTTVQTIQTLYLGAVSFPSGYGSLVILNGTAVATAADGVEQAVLFLPIQPVTID